MFRNVLMKGGLDAVDEHIHSPLTVDTRCLACDMQQTYNGIFDVLGLDGLLSFLMLHSMGGIAFLVGLDHCLHVLIGSQINALHVTGCHLYSLLP